MEIQLLPKHHTRYFHAIYLKHSIAILDEQKTKKRILDLGCGQGGLTLQIKRLMPAGQIDGCDIDKESLKIFSKTAKKQNISLSHADAHQLPYKSKIYDAVFMMDVLEHVDNPKQVLLEVKRVLKTKGVFHLIIPCESDLLTIDGWIKKFTGKNLKKKPIGHIQQFTLKDIKKLLKDTDFKLVHLSYSYYFIYQTLSLLYYLSANIFNHGNYVSLKVSHKKTQTKLDWFIKLGGWTVYLESLVLSHFQGQTAHITAIKN